MKFSNFKVLKTVLRNTVKETVYGTVDVTEGFWFWKQTKTIDIFKPWGFLWYRLSDGTPLPLEVSRTYDAYVAREAAKESPK